MADDTVPAAAHSTTAEPELHIEMWLDNWAHYEGTAAQLVAEGPIPTGFEWPRAREDKNWEADGFKFWLRRTRPAGHKGLMRSWLELDNWFVRVRVASHDFHWRTRRELERRAEELRRDLYSHTAEGLREHRASWRRYLMARDDACFQSFKNTLPGLVPPKRGRKPKSV